MESRVRASTLAPIIVVVIGIAAGMNAIDATPIGVFYDDALYTILGKAIASGEGYRYLNIPGAPPATHYPPGYPALLALLWKISPTFPQNVALFKTTNALLLGVVAFFTYRFARLRLEFDDKHSAAMAIAATATIPPLVISSAVVSETMFLAVLLPSLLALERWIERGSIRDAVVAGAIAGALCLVRSHAIALIAAIGTALLLRRLYKEGAISAGIGLIVLLPWLIRVKTHDPLIPAPIRGQYGSYTSWFVDGLRDPGPRLVLAAVRDNVVTTYAIVARSFSIARNGVLDAIAVLAVVTLSIAGVIALRRRARVTLLFLAFYVCIALVWPFSPLRFIWGVWPLLVLLMLEGARALWWSTLDQRVTRGVCIAASVIVLVGAAVFNVLGYRNAWWATVSRSFTPRIRAQLEWVANRAEPGAVMAGSDEGAVFLYTGRPAVPTSIFRAEQYFATQSAEKDERDMATIVREFRPSYLLAWTLPSQHAAAALAAQHPPLLVAVDTMTGGRVFRIP